MQARWFEAALPAAFPAAAQREDRFFYFFRCRPGLRRRRLEAIGASSSQSVSGCCFESKILCGRLVRHLVVRLAFEGGDSTGIQAAP